MNTAAPQKVIKCTKTQEQTVFANCGVAQAKLLRTCNECKKADKTGGLFYNPTEQMMFMLCTKCERKTITN